MKNFMIGMHGQYDYKKFERDYRKDFFGVQVCLFQDEKEIENLSNEIGEKGFKLGVHFPLRAWSCKLRDPQFLSLNEEITIDAYRHIEDELKYINQKKLKPEFILFHYPKPVLIKEDFDMRNWRFADSSEYTYETKYPYDKFKKNSEYLFKWLSEKSVEYNFTPVLEFDALNKYVCKENFLENLLEKYKRIKICLDTGRLHLQHKIDAEFNDIDIIKRFSKYTEVIHLWNVKVNENLENSHFPALPGLKPEDGWAEIEEYLKIILKGNKTVKIMFEHRSDLISDEELESCYTWINHISLEIGHITADNVMLDCSGRLYIIDFADGRVAPKEYEFPPILFDLFDFDKVMIDEFIGEKNIKEFTERCFYGILMHEFGIYFVKLICKRIINIDICELRDILEVKKALYSFFAEK